MTSKEVAALPREFSPTPNTYRSCKPSSEMNAQYRACHAFRYKQAEERFRTLRKSKLYANVFASISILYVQIISNRITKF
jgi:hypothetical protein